MVCLSYIVDTMAAADLMGKVDRILLVMDSIDLILPEYVGPYKLIIKWPAIIKE